MKKVLSKITSAVYISAFLLLCLCGCAGKNGEGTGENPSSDTVITEPSQKILKNTYQLCNLTTLFPLEVITDSNGTRCHVVQGGCTDGRYYYVAMNDGQSQSADSISAICKYDLKTGELVNTYEGKTVSHCNDMTLNTETNELIVVHNTPDLTCISIFDATTLELKEKKYLALQIYSMAYDPYEHCYWVGISYGYNFAKLDLHFNQIGDIYKGTVTGYVKQGMDVDSKYIYFLQYKTNCVMVYDKSGALVKQLNLSIPSGEPQNICHVGDVFYVGFFSPTPTLYEGKIENAE